MRIQKSRMRCVGIFWRLSYVFAVQQSYGAQNMHDITQAEPDHLAVHTMSGSRVPSLISRTFRTDTVRTGASDRQCTDHAAECRTQHHFVGRTCKRICRECYPDLSGILPYRKHICAQPCVDHGIHTLAGWGKSF